MKKTIAAAAALLLLLGACSDPQGTEPGEAAVTAGGDAADETAAPDDGAGSKGDGSKPGGDSAGSGSGKRGGGGSGDGGSGGPRGSGGGGKPGFTGGGGDSLGYPAAGEYSYAQEGFERFCQGPSCSKQPLPETATITASITDRSASDVTVVSESRSSDRQTIRSTTRYTRAAALIAKVVIDFSFGSFDFSQEYEPQPPVESLSFPLEVGKSWRGRWKARTSGDYRMNVVSANNGVFRIETVTNFRGDFSGRAQATIWVDGSNGVVVRTDGQIAVASGFGEYSSSFRTLLRSGPGY